MTEPIRALLLAAGLGTRLRPLTLTTPKCLVPIGGQTLLERWLQNLEACGCSDAIVNTHYLADQVLALLEKSTKWKMNIQSTYETELLGTAGTLIANQSFFEGSTGLLIHADNATNLDLRMLLEAHERRPKGCVMTMLPFSTKQPENCGIAVVDKTGILQQFHEKVPDPPGNKANGAVYVLDKSFFRIISNLEKPVNDFSKDIIPILVGKIFTYHTQAKFYDIGTPVNLKEAQLQFKNEENK